MEFNSGLSSNMTWIKIVILLIQISALHGQLTGITLDPTTNIIKDTRLGNEDMSRVHLIPPTTVAACYVTGAVSVATGLPVDHPFNIRYQAIPFEWYVIFDSTSPFKLNSAVTPIYTVTVECLENTFTQTADLTIQVLPNQIPAIIDYPGTTKSFVASSVPVGTLLYKVTATDGDGDTMTYSYNIQPNVNYFTIDPVTQEIRAAVDFQSVELSLITLTVDVSDGFDTVSGFTLQIQITNLNIRPQITNLPTAILMKEDANGGTLLKDLTFLDPDFPGTFQPSCSVIPAVSPSIITVSGSRVALATGSSGTGLLDYETTTSYQITCTIYDGYLFSQNDILTLNVEDVNEKPIFNQQIYNCQLYESKAGVSTCNLFINVIDPENDAYTISIRPGNFNNRFAFVGPAADVLSFAVEYDVDNNAMPSNVMVDIEARDTKGEAGLAQISISVSDENDNTPSFPAAPAAIDIDDFTALGVVSFVLATDDDSGLNGEVKYTLTSITPIAAANYVQVFGDGQIHYTQKFPANLAGSTASLTILAEDKGVPTRSASTIRTVNFIQIPPTTPPPPTSPPLTTPLNLPTSIAPEAGYFDEPANIAMVAILGLIVLIALLIALFFCMKKILLGYCCTKPPHRSGRIQPSYGDYDEPDVYYTPARRHYSGYSGYPPYYGDPDEYVIDPRAYRDPRMPLSASSIRGEFYDSRSGNRSKKSRLAIPPY